MIHRRFMSNIENVMKNRMKVITCTIHWSLMHDDTSAYSSIQMYVSACWHAGINNMVTL